MKYPLSLLLCLFISLSLYAQTDSLLDQARECVTYRDYKCVIIKTTQVLLKEPHNKDALKLRAFAFNWIAAYAEALADEQHLLSLDPGDAFQNRNAAWHSLLLKKYTQGLNYGLKALKLKSSDHRNALVVAHAYALLEDDDKVDYYYKMAAEYVPRELDAADALAEIDTLVARKLFPYQPKPIKELFYYSWEDYGANATTSILEQINYHTTLENKSEFDDDVIKLKEDFVSGEINQKYSRYYVLRDFCWQLGWYHMKHRNKLKAMELYFPKSISASALLKDTTMLVQQFFDLSATEDKSELRTANGLLQTAIGWATSCKKVRDEMRLNLLLRLSDNYAAQHLFDSALYTARRGYQFAQKLKDPSLLAATTNRLYVRFASLNQFDSVFYYHDISRKLESASSEDEVLTLDHNLCTLLYQAKEYKQAFDRSKQYAESYSVKKNPVLDIAKFYQVAGMSLYKLKQYDKAEEWLKNGIETYKDWLRNNHVSDPEKTPSIVMKNCYKFLKAIAMEKEKPAAESLFELAENSKANNFFVSVSGNNYVSDAAKLKQVQKGLADDEVILSYNFSGDNNNSYLIAVTKASAEVISLPLSQSAALFEKFELSKWTPMLTEAAKLMYANLPDAYDLQDLDYEQYKNTFLLAAAVSWYKNGLLSTTPARGLNLRKKDTANANYQEEFTRKSERLLYHVLLGQVKTLLKDKRVVYIIEDQITTMIPFEILKDEEGGYLGNRYSIIYLPSASVQEMLSKRESIKLKNVLAIGNPDYRDYKPRQTGRAYDLAALGMTSWSDLPGTEKELASIKEKAPNTEVVQKEAVSETWIKERSAEGKLNNGIIHFAVHGLYSINDYEDNSLVLTEPEGSDEDGFLQFSEIKNLQLKAKLVCLSACETAQAISSGDIAPNLITAFLMAGANGVVATSWKVDDEATALFMKEFYAHIFSEKMNITEAIMKTRQSFIQGKYGEKYKSPYYWGAFKYTGINQ